MLWGEGRQNGKAEEQTKRGVLGLAGQLWEPQWPEASFTSLHHVRSHQCRCQRLLLPTHLYIHLWTHQHAHSNATALFNLFRSLNTNTHLKCLHEMLSLNLDSSPPFSTTPMVRFHSNSYKHTIHVLNMDMRREAYLMAAKGSPFSELPRGLPLNSPLPYSHLFLFHCLLLQPLAPCVARFSSLSISLCLQ